MRDQYVVSQLRVICGLAYCVSCQGVPASELVTDPDHTYLITHVWVPKEMRGRRYGRITLERVCHDADAEGATLILSVAPDYDSPLKYDGTLAFYQRHGFELISDRYHGAMRRAPRRL